MLLSDEECGLKICKIAGGRGLLEDGRRILGKFLLMKTRRERSGLVLRVKKFSRGG